MTLPEAKETIGERIREKIQDGYDDTVTVDVKSIRVISGSKIDMVVAVTSDTKHGMITEEETIVVPVKPEEVIGHWLDKNMGYVVEMFRKDLEWKVTDA
tara:strand:- start:626 stop:922 length:297 start_codon:yes stop_codon:yes gene_type:complete